METEALKYPIGKFRKPETVSEAELREAIQVLHYFPEQLKLLTYQLPRTTLDRPYRPGGWSIRQLVHHIADSHHHCYNRLRWALTEDTPLIKAYNQDAFAALEDYKTAPISWSLAHIEAIHQKIVVVLKGLTKAQWERKFIHPESGDEVSIKQMVVLYEWHSMHHFTHIKNALQE